MAINLYLYKAGSDTGAHVTGISRSVTPVEWNEWTVAWNYSLTVEGYLYGDGSSAISGLMNTFETKMLTQDQEVSIANGSGTNVGHVLTTGTALDGVRTMNFSWTNSPLHMATEAGFTVTFEALYPNTSEDEVVEFNETVTIVGEGGALKPLAPQASTQSIRQTVRQYSDVVVTQSGTVVGRTGYPNLPSAVILDGDAKQQNLTRDQKSVTQKKDAVLTYRRSYSYTFTLPAHPGVVNPNTL